MRFSPTLLACCTVAALAGQPVQADTIPETVLISTETSVADGTQTSPIDRSSPAELIANTAIVPVQGSSEPLTANLMASFMAPEAAVEEAAVEDVRQDSLLPEMSMTLDTVLADANLAQPQTDSIRQNLAQASPEESPEESSEESPEEESSDKLQRLLDGIGQEPEAVPPQTAPPDAEAVPVDPNPTPPPESTEPTTQEPEEETRVLVAEVAVATPTGEFLPPELVDTVYNAVETEPGRTTTRSALQSDINNVFGTGFFSNVRAVPDDTPLGVRVTFLVEPNPVLTSVQIRDNQVLPETVVEEIFSPQYGSILNLIEFQDGVLDLNQWYQDNGYVLAQVTAAPQVSDSGVVTLIVAEGVIENIEVRYITSDGDTVDEEGNLLQGRTRPFIVTREFESEPGEVFQQDAIQEDLQRVFGLGIFEDVRLSLDPGDEDPRKVKVVVNVAESNTGSVGAAAGFNLQGDIFGSVSYQQDNFGGNNQKLRTEVQLSSRDLLFDASFTDPWIAGDPNRTSYTVNAFNRRSISLIFDNGVTPVTLTNGDVPRVSRFGGGVSFSRPLSDRSTGSIGFNYQRVSTRDGGGTVTATDSLGNPLTLSGTGRDDLFTIPISYVVDNRNDSSVPTSGNLLRLGTEQSIPIGTGSIFFNRLRASYSQYVPVSFLNFGEGPQSLAFNVQVGTVLGDLPPYEAFSLGGTNSIRGFEEGDVGSGRSFLQATAEYRFPLFSSFLGGAFFVDAGTDLGSGSSIIGDPAGVRGKPGSGIGYGAGLRVQTPLGALRLDYGFSDQGNSRIHFGIGERF